MPGITFAAFRDGLPTSLEDLLRVLGPQGRASEWSISRLETAPGATSESLVALADRGTALPGDQLIALSRGVQVIDGEFEARGNDGKTWVLLRAVDGTSWDVLSDDQGVVSAFERAFPDAGPLP